MDLDKALRLVDDKCDVDLPRLKAQYHAAVQQKFGEQSARGLLLGNRTAVIVKDELNRLINEKGMQYLWHYSQVLPSVASDDYVALETKLLKHFKASSTTFTPRPATNSTPPGDRCRPTPQFISRKTTKMPRAVGMPIYRFSSRN